MIDEAKHDGQAFTNAFARYYPKDEAVGMTLLISTFVSCYAMMELKDRFHTLSTLFEIVKDISGERFEDGHDFVEFMKQMVTEPKDNP